jgi:hypothetical protein
LATEPKRGQDPGNGRDRHRKRLRDLSRRHPQLNIPDTERATELLDLWRGGSYLDANESTGDYLLTWEAAIAMHLLDAHARGYSTTTHDLINDLLPF